MVTKFIGKGSYGVVARANDLKTDTSVALKIIKNKSSFEKQAKIEIKILEKLKALDPEEQFNTGSFYLLV